MFDLTNFELFLPICIVNAMIFIKDKVDKLVQDQFLQILKYHQYDKFSYVLGFVISIFFLNQI